MEVDVNTLPIAVYRSSYEKTIERRAEITLDKKAGQILKKIKNEKDQGFSDKKAKIDKFPAVSPKSNQQMAQKRTRISSNSIS